ncbi:MAG: ATP-grasp domain-containing protein [Anaerolineaceae bacterium]|nr:ATP-grasp domain-containing protein [Anaerolineaceae bacterium]
MILLEKPFISDLFKNTIQKNQFPVIDTPVAREFDLPAQTLFISEEEAVQKFKENKNSLLYTTSENAINWISNHLSFTDLPEKINLFKDKCVFRDLLAPAFPDFFYQEVQLNELSKLSIENLPKPFIIKPAVGFFSLGVYKVLNNADWPGILDRILAEVKTISHLYPNEVLDIHKWIIEECIQGTEFAMDAYFDDLGEPILLGLYKHEFSSELDVSDRVYLTSKNIFEEYSESFLAFLKQIGTLTNLKNFPVHVEVRVNESGKLTPIEVNPLRFGGWCTTADMTTHAYGFNPYEYLLLNKKPDWKEILKTRAGKVYALVVLDNSTGIEGKQIASFDYDRMRARFNKTLDIRPVDFHKWPVFGFLLIESREEDYEEIEFILKSDLREFITI